MRRWSIYGLSDPRTGEVRYIGRTSGELARRLQALRSETCNARRREWILELRAAGLVPGIAELASAETWPGAQAVEQDMIEAARKKGWPLLNAPWRNVGVGSGAPTDRCGFRGCGRDALVAGYCSAHYQQRRRSGSLRPTRTAPGSGDRITVRLPRAAREAVAVLAASAGVDSSTWIRDLVEARIASQAPDTQQLFDAKNKT